MILPSLFLHFFRQSQYITTKNDVTPVGNVLKIDEQGILRPFHAQYLKMDLCPSLFGYVKSVKSKQGKLVYHNAENMFP